MNDIVISGLKTTHKSFARVAHTPGEEDHQDAPDPERATLEQQVTTYL